MPFVFSLVFFIAALFSAAAMPNLALAQGFDAQIEGAKLCTRNLARYERIYGIPSHLLSAISATESGRYHEGLKIALPWPWTINVEGQGHYFDNKQEAIAAVKSFQRQGARSIDVGCMQVNLLHHPEAFANIEAAFDPEKNVAYGASFLRSLYEENKSWKQAAANYHSKTKLRGKEYVGRVFDRWTNILTRLREVKAAAPESTAAAINEKQNEKIQAALPLPERKRINVASNSSFNAISSQPKPKIRMKEISVKSFDNRQIVRDNGVLVIRPEVKLVDNAYESASTPPAIPPLAPIAKVIRVAQTKRAEPIVYESKKIAQASTINSNKKSSGPRFIFDN